ncbi:hypothetical protein Tco_1268632, partial [Tanacetum coccineum]
YREYDLAHWNGYLRKGRKTKPKRQNRTWNGKAWKRQSQDKAQKRRKHFAAKRAEEKRNRPPTKAQQRSIMVNTFMEFKTELVEESSKKAKAKIAQEGSSKRIRAELEQEVHKKQKMDDDQETAKLKSLMEVNPDEEEVVIDAWNGYLRKGSKDQRLTLSCFEQGSK